MAKALDPRASVMPGGGGEEIVKAGWLSKRGDRNKSMKRRWCVVKDGNLEYFETPQQAVCSGSIVLKSSLVEKSDKENAHLQCFFFITPAAKPTDSKEKTVDRTYVFCAETSNEVIEWLNVFEDCDANVIRSVKEGVMNKSDSKGKNWTRRYFVLFEDRLLYYADPKDRQPKGSVPLLHAGIIVEEAYGEKNFMFEIKGTTDSEDGGRTFTLSCFNEDDRRDWMRAIQRLITAKTAPKNPNCTREGWLYLGHKGSWLHRYFVLLNGKLMYYRHKMDEIEEGNIDLSLGARFDIKTLHNSNGNTEDDKKQVVLPGARGLLNAVSGSISNQASSLLTASLALAKSDIFRPEIVVSLAETYDANARIHLISCGKKEEMDLWITNLTQTINHFASLMSKQQVNTYPGSILEGYLNKCNAAMNSWNHRYFVLFEEKLLYFKNKGDHLLSPAGEVALPAGFEMSLEPDFSNPDYEQVKNLNIHNLFSVCSSGDEGERRMYMQAKDSIERQTWMNALTNLWKKKLHRVNPYSLRECYVCTRTALGKSKRFLILLNDKISLFKKRMDDVPEKEVLLVPGTWLERESGPTAKDQSGVEINLDRRIICNEYADDSGRKTVLEFSSKDVREDWMTAVNGLGFLSAKIKPGSIKEGYGKKQGGSRKGWKLRYLVLTEKQLSYYAKLRDTEAAGVIELTETTKATLDLPNGEENCMSIDNGTGRIYRLQFGDAQSLQGWHGAITNVLNAFKSGRLFGGCLEDHCKVSPYAVPRICFDLIESLKHTALSLEGIFRVPGNNELIQSGVQLFEDEYRNACEGKSSSLESPVASYTDPHSVAGILKLYYRKLRIPIIPFDLYTKFAGVDDVKIDKNTKISTLSNLVNELPAINRTLLAYQLDLLRLVANNVQENKMNAKNCAMVFAPGLLRKPEEQQSLDPQLLVKELEVSQNVLTLMLEGYASVFPQGCPDPRSAKSGGAAARNVMGVAASKPRPAPAPQATQKPALAPLPPEWQEHKNQDGIPFYYNTITLQSVWVRPVAEPSRSQTPPPPPLVENDLPPSFETRPSAFAARPSAIDARPSAIDARPSAIDARSSVVDIRRSTAIDARPSTSVVSPRIAKPVVPVLKEGPPRPVQARDASDVPRTSVAFPDPESSLNLEKERAQEAVKAKSASEAAWAEAAHLIPSNDQTWQELSKSVEQQKIVVARAQEQLALLQARLDHRTKEVHAAREAATANAERLAKIASAAGQSATHSSKQSSETQEHHTSHHQLASDFSEHETPPPNLPMSLPPITPQSKPKPLKPPPKTTAVEKPAEPDPGPCSECGCTSWKINPFKKGSCQNCFHKH